MLTFECKYLEIIFNISYKLKLYACDNSYFIKSEYHHNGNKIKTFLVQKKVYLYSNRDNLINVELIKDFDKRT